MIREVYNDWSAQRGTTVAIARTDTAGTAPPPLTWTHRKRWATAGKQLVQRVKTWLQFPSGSI